MELLQQHVTGERPALPAALCVYEPLVTRLMARERNDRYADMEAVLAELDKLPAAAEPCAEPARQSA